MAPESRLDATEPEQPAGPARVAAIDVGATSVRMEVAELPAQGPVHSLDRLVHPVSLGSDTFRNGQVSPGTLRALCRVLTNFSRVLAEYQVDETRAMATSAVREAANRDILVDRIRHESGIRIEVLDAVAEMRLTYQVLLPFLRQRLTEADTYTLILDLGGGSTEIMLLRDESPVQVATRRLGAARLFQLTGEGEPAADAQLLVESVVRNAVATTRDLYRAYPIRQCLVINPLLARALAHEPQTRAVDEGVDVPTAHVNQVASEATTLSPEALSARFHVDLSSAEQLRPALLVLQQFLRPLHLEEVSVLQIDLLSGILHDIALSRRGGARREELVREQVLGSSSGVAQKYHYDEAHSRQVTRLAVQLFDELAGFLDLGGRDRLYLEVAGILHDIGRFVSERAHHKHSAYLVQWAEISGLSNADLQLVSLVVRYHRKAHPRQQHLEFTSHPLADRLRVTKLAALLRIADALDRSHRQCIRSLKTERTEDTLTIFAQSNDDIAVELLALRGKAELFEEITGLKVELRRVTP